MNVTQTWMMGVVSVMLIFGLIAVVGYFKQKSQNNLVGASKRGESNVKTQE